MTLCKDHKHKAMKVHRLVLLTFEKRVIGKDAVHHKDHNRKNNELSNLMWVTPITSIKGIKGIKLETKEGVLSAKSS